MDEDQQIVVQQAPPENDMSWDGRTATGPNGQRIVWRGNRRTGRFVAMNYENADPQSRERVEAVQNMALIGQRTLPTAEEFMRRNATTQTGGLQNTLEGWPRAVAAGIRPQMFAQADSLDALSNQMIGQNWQPGTTGMYNTGRELELARARFPSPTRLGRANISTYVTMAEGVAVQQQAVQAMQEWLNSHTNLQGFDADWARREPAVRQRAREQAMEFVRNTWGGQAPAAQPGQSVQDGITIDAQGRIVR